MIFGSCYLDFESLCSSVVCVRSLIARNTNSLTQEPQNHYDTADVLYFLHIVGEVGQMGCPDA